MSGYTAGSSPTVYEMSLKLDAERALADDLAHVVSELWSSELDAPQMEMVENVLARYREARS